MNPCTNLGRKKQKAEALQPCPWGESNTSLSIDHNNYFSHLVGAIYVDPQEHNLLMVGPCIQTTVLFRPNVHGVSPVT
jgi:hypothetical protein